jgi:Lon protease-like protein
VVLIREGGEVGPAETFDVGTMARITDFDQLPDGLLGLSCVGERRFRIVKRSVQPMVSMSAKWNGWPWSLRCPCRSATRG